MKMASSRFSPNTWKKLMVLGQKQGLIRIEDLSQELGMNEAETVLFLGQVFPVGIGSDIFEKDNQRWVNIDANAVQYMLPLSPAEWMHLHQVLSETVVTDLFHQPVFTNLKQKVSDNGPIKVVMELLEQLDVWDKQLSEVHQKMISQLDHAVAMRSLIKITTVENKNYLLYPSRILHLEGKLSIVAEDSLDHCLTVISLCDVHAMSEIETSKLPKVSVFEVEEFISAIRAMNEKETRLILKINDSVSANLFPHHHFLGKPCMVTNPNGDIIWAAYVEPCDDLYDWLITLGRKVEILDPTGFRQDFLSYCEDKVRKIA